MHSRSAASPAALRQRASAMRRLRRRAAANHPYCATNGCTTYLTIDPIAGAATCPVCGYRRRLS